MTQAKFRLESTGDDPSCDYRLFMNDQDISDCVNALYVACRMGEVPIITLDIFGTLEIPKELEARLKVREAA